MDLRRRWSRVLGLCAALAIGAAAAGCECKRIQQQLFVDMADPALQPLLDACKAHQAAPGEACPPATSYPDIDCGCLPLCLRLLEIADQFDGMDSIEECHYRMPSTSGTMMSPVTAGVSVTYRPATCP